MLKRFLFMFCVGLFSVTVPGKNLDAQGTGGLVISPKRIALTSTDRSAEVLLANRGDVEKRYRISFVNKKMTQSGGLEDTTEPAEGEFFADGVIRYAPRQVTLAPRETQKVKLLSRLKGNAPEGEYRSHLLVQEIPNENLAPPADPGSEDGLAIQIQAIFGLTIPVIVRKGELTHTADLSDPVYRNIDGEHFVDFFVERTGNKSLLGTAKVFADGQEVGILKNVAVYLSVPRRRVSIKLNSENVNNFVGKEIRITFGEVSSKDDAPPAEITFKAI